MQQPFAKVCYSVNFLSSLIINNLKIINQIFIKIIPLSLLNALYLLDSYFVLDMKFSGCVCVIRN